MTTVGGTRLSTWSKPDHPPALSTVVHTAHVTCRCRAAPLREGVGGVIHHSLLAGKLLLSGFLDFTLDFGGLMAEWLEFEGVKLETSLDARGVLENKLLRARLVDYALCEFQVTQNIGCSYHRVIM